MKGGLWRGLLLGWGGCGGGDWWAIDLDPLISGNLLKVRQRRELCPDGQIFVNYRPLCRGKLQIVVDRLFVHQSERRCSRSRNRKGMKRWICTITNVQLCSAINLIKVCHKLDLLQIKHIRRINPPLCHLLGPPPPLQSLLVPRRLFLGEWIRQRQRWRPFTRLETNEGSVESACGS